MVTTTGRARRLAIASTLICLLAGSALPAGTLAANDTIAGVDVAPHYYRGADGATIRLSLRRPARVTVTIRRANGAVVRTLARNVRLAAGPERFTWNGRTGVGRKLRDGTYRLKITASNGRGVDTLNQRFRKGLPRIYPARPGAIVVAIDPGHGGPYLGAFYRGSHEKAFNLDIAFRLRNMLRASGVKVVLSRTTDRVVNNRGRDVNGDGKVSKADDLAARIDSANLARADVHVSIHNNSAGCRCVRGTEVFTSRRRSWTPEGYSLATMLHREQLRALSMFRSARYRPIDRGVKSGQYYVMSPYNARRLPRPSLMPTVLTESLFVNNAVELSLLRRADVRQSLAVAFYVGIANYINTRDYGVGYRLLREPRSPIAAGARARYVIRVTNRGNRPSAGWVLQLRAVRQVPLYDGSERFGRLLGSRRIPNGLRPGQSVDIVINARAPARAGFWTVKAGVRIGARSRPMLSQRGVVELQTPLRTRR